MHHHYHMLGFCVSLHIFLYHIALYFCMFSYCCLASFCESRLSDMNLLHLLFIWEISPSFLKDTFFKYNILHQHCFFLLELWMCLSIPFWPVRFHFYFLRFHLFIFRDGRREGEREGEKHQDLTHNPGTCSDWESNLATLWFGGQCSVHWASPIRAWPIRFLLRNLLITYLILLV